LALCVNNQSANPNPQTLLFTRITFSYEALHIRQKAKGL